MILISGRNKHQISNESIEGKDPYMWYKYINYLFWESILGWSFFHWIHRTNGHTGYVAQQNINSKSSTRVFLDWIHKTNKTYGQTKFSSKEFYMCLFRLDTQDKRTNRTKQINKSYGQTKYSFTDYYMCLFRLDTQDKLTNKTKQTHKSYGQTKY